MSIEATSGALLLGSLASIYLSGTVVMQAVVYFQVYSKDHLRTKLTVASIWLLDFIHTGMVTASNWFYLIDNFGISGTSDRVPWTVAASIALTALLTFIVHSFFAHRVFTLSNRNWLITAPISILALARLGFACTTTYKLITLKSFSVFVSKVSWVFTMGLSLAVAVDILIAGSLCWFLNKNRTGFSGMDSIINSITLYTIENGLLTCVVTILSLIFWITMPHNLVFLAMHFAISKMYANALLATLNSRKRLRGRSQSSSDREMPVRLPNRRTSRANQYSSRNNSRTDNQPISSKIHVSAEKGVDFEYDDINIELPRISGGSGDTSYPPSPPAHSQTRSSSKFSERQLTFVSV